MKMEMKLNVNNKIDYILIQKNKIIMKEKLSKTFWCVLGILVGGIFTYGGMRDGSGDLRIYIGPVISLVNIWVLYMTWKDDNS